MRASIPHLAAACLALLALCFATELRAQDDVVATATSTLNEVEEAIPATRSDYNGLLVLRNRVEAVRNDLRDKIRELNVRRAELQQQISQLGPKPAGEEAATIVDHRRVLTDAQVAFEAQYRPLLLVGQRSERLWDRLTEMRRQIFSSRLLMYVASIVDPFFWADFVTNQVPRVIGRTAIVAGRWKEYVQEHDTVLSGLVVLASAILLLGLFVWLHRFIAARRRQAEARTDGSHHQLAAIRRGFVILAMRTVPLPGAMLIFNFILRRLNAAPEEVDTFLLAVAIALFLVGLARGTMSALLSPKAPAWRIVRAQDSTARIVTDLVTGAVDLYTVGILLTSFQHLISARIAVEVATIMIITTAMIATTLWRLQRLGREQTPVHGFVNLNLGWTRPIVTLACIAAAILLVFGYVSLAGFIAGRITMSAGAISVALFIVTALNHVFDQHRPSETRTGASLTRSFGLSGATLDVVATALSGIARFIVIAMTALFVLAPWGLEYGDVNPFQDLANFITTTDLRSWLGSVGFALLAFIIGIAGTRLIVGWLDSTLLPRMSLDDSIRHSIRTVLGYAGFAATVLVTLSLMGINAQNVAVVAGALSVGIGFGLQSIVSNFVSGLIVLAERPVRVGDVVVVKGEEGRVQRISVRSTLIGTFEQSSLIVPNSDLITSIVRNRTLADPTQQLRFNLVIDPDTDAAKAAEILSRICLGHANVLKAPAPRILFMRITELGQEFEIRCNVDRFENMIQVRSDLHHRVAQTFRAEGMRFARISPEIATLAGSSARALPPRAVSSG